MNFKLNNNKDLVLLHTNMSKVAYGKSINLLLSPQFYTIKKESLDIKYKYQAQKIASSVMDDLLPHNKEHQFSVFKEDERWVFVAIDEDKIKSFLLSQNIDINLVHKIYIAQQVKDKFNIPILLDDKKAIGLLNNIVTIFPKNALDKTQRYAYLDNSFTPASGGVSISGESSSLIDQKSSIILSAVFVLFAFIFLFEGTQYSKEATISEDKLAQKLQKHPSLASKYSRDSIEKKYKKIDLEQRAIRDFLKNLASPIRMGGTLTALNLNKTTQKATLKTNSNDIYIKVQQKAKSLNLNTKSIENNSFIELESKI